MLGGAVPEGRGMNAAQWCQGATCATITLTALVLISLGIWQTGACPVPPFVCVPFALSSPRGNKVADPSSC